MWAGCGDYLVAGARLLVSLLVIMLKGRRAVALVLLWSLERCNGGGVLPARFLMMRQHPTRSLPCCGRFDCCCRGCRCLLRWTGR